MVCLAGFWIDISEHVQDPGNPTYVCKTLPYYRLRHWRVFKITSLTRVSPYDGRCLDLSLTLDASHYPVPTCGLGSWHCIWRSVPVRSSAPPRDSSLSAIPAQDYLGPYLRAGIFGAISGENAVRSAPAPRPQASLPGHALIPRCSRGGEINLLADPILQPSAFPRLGLQCHMRAVLGPVLLRYLCIFIRRNYAAALLSSGLQYSRLAISGWNRCDNRPMTKVPYPSIIACHACTASFKP